MLAGMPEARDAPRIIRQSAVIPYRRTDEGLKVLLITSSRRKRWIVPKGLVEPHLSEAESALQEAFEEAGIQGDISADPIGSYTYSKWGATCVVAVFLLEVRTVLSAWPEAAVRQRRWMSVAVAANAVEEPALRVLILDVPRLVSP
jgi:8-oxo-dGTP pyrophosphatase MutT (NUDIX family)